MLHQEAGCAKASFSAQRTKGFAIASVSEAKMETAAQPSPAASKTQWGPPPAIPDGLLTAI
jgi:hypothetical protein